MRKGVYPYEYMGNLEKVKEASLLQKDSFYSHLNTEVLLMQIMCTQKTVCKDFEIKIVRRVSWLVCSNWYIIVSWCICEL